MKRVISISMLALLLASCANESLNERLYDLEDSYRTAKAFYSDDTLECKGRFVEAYLMLSMDQQESYKAYRDSVNAESVKVANRIREQTKDALRLLHE